MKAIPKKVREATRQRDSIDGCVCCIYCGRPFPNGGEHLHHVKKRSQLGEDTEQNLVSLCFTCHMKIHDGDRDIQTYCEDYLERIYR